ncbi:MAG: hypothetical protein AAFX44_09245 [Pseudomonadota bacterium]
MTDDSQLTNALRGLGDESANPDSWPRIAARAEALGLLADRSAPQRRRTQMLWPLALAATALLALVVMRWPTETTGPIPVVDETATIDVLMRQSQLLEAWLRHAPPPPRAVTVGTASRETVLRDRIAAIDWELGSADVSMDPARQAALWGERTQRMRELVELRFRQTPRSDL